MAVLPNALLLLALKMFYDSTNQMASVKEIERAKKQPKTKACAAENCNAELGQIQVDPAVSTVLKDERVGGSTFAGVSKYVQDMRAREAREHPGVVMIQG
jgi:hypothetical protein